MIRRIAFLGFILASTAALAQTPTLQFDASSGQYSLRYVDESGTLRVARFFGQDQVAPDAGLAIEGTGPFDYSYSLSNDAAARLPLFRIVFACDQSATSRMLRPRLTLKVRDEGPVTGVVCRWTLARGDDDLGPGPGESFNGALHLYSAWLPGIRQGAGYGASEEVNFVGFREEAPDMLQQLVLSTKRPKGFHLLAPKYPVTVFQDPVRGTAAIRDEVLEACRLGWADAEGICEGLSQKAGLAVEAAQRGEFKLVSERLRALSSELRAQAGKHVNASFASALVFDANFLLASTGL